VSRTTPFSQAPFADTWFSASTSGSYQNPIGPALINQGAPGYVYTGYNGVWCNPIADNIVRPFMNNKTRLEEYIDGFKPFAGTSIDMGIKWGLAMLDPDMQPAINALANDTTIAANDRIPGTFANRPAPFKGQQTNLNRTMKVIVLMTDGENSDKVATIKAGFKSGFSPIYRSGASGFYSIYHDDRAGTSKYYRPDNNSWSAAPYAASGETAIQQTWSDVWRDLRVKWVAQQLYARPNPTNSGKTTSERYADALAMLVDETSSTDKDTRLEANCNMAKSKDILIYGIAMDSTAHGKLQVEKCSTSWQHYYEVTNLNVATAFNSIAANISQLRLSQ
jgi:hypothetical protein